MTQMLFKETSAKGGLNVDQMMEEVVQAVFERGIKCATKAVRLSGKSGEKRKEESSCCG